MFSWRTPRRIPLIAAHRGASANAPENTLAAFRQAVDDGADAIELDVRLSKDRQVVVIHDATLGRTTKGRGRVRDYSLEELQQWSAGTWYHKKFFSEKIPTLAEVFARVPRHIGINIELKYDRRARSGHRLVEQCLNVIHHARRSDAVLVSSFHHPYIKALKSLDPSIATGCLYHPVKDFGRSPVSLARSLRADFLIMNRRYLTKLMVSQAHRHNLLVGGYTIDTQRHFKRALRFRIDAVYTNDPAGIVKINSSR